MTTIAICTGGACRKENSDKLLKKVQKAVEKQDLKDRIAVESCSCLKDCKKAPVAEIRPGDTHLLKVKPKKADKIIAAALDSTARKVKKKK